MKSRLVAILFAVSVFVSAFLLFQVQPLISKAILPWFGGTPNVWTTCLLFFQSVLFGGYLYAHLLTSKCSSKVQAGIHIGLLTLAAITIHIVPDPSWKPNGTGAPVWLILQLLLVTVGLPYFMLSTTGPLLQAWFGRTFPGRSPYRLYALSNVGSLLALLSYPFVFEPVIGMNLQASLWSTGFIGLAVLCGLCAIVSATTRFSAAELAQPAEISESSATTATQQPASPGKWWQWFGLSMLASVMLLATTNQVCQDVAVVPFLWVVPLSLYLLTFILCFEGDRWYHRRLYGLAAALSVGMINYIMTFPMAVSFAVQVVIYFGGLFVICMVCHGELARLKPAPERLTAFYLTMSAGGACGGIFVGVIAPLIFPLYLELNYGLVVCCLVALLVFTNELFKKNQNSWSQLFFYSTGIVVVTALAVTQQSHANTKLRTSLDIERNFYGVLRTEYASRTLSENPATVMWHGRILHGLQLRGEKLQMTPTSYYGHDSGVGRAFEFLQRQGESLRVGMVGLGTGTLASYGRKGDVFRFYEINDAAVRMAKSRFTFLSDTPAEVEIVMGDARLMMEQEDDQHYDLLILDAFSGDSVPTHLLTREAVAVYRRHLKPNGVLAVHISNLHFDLKPVAAAVADEAGLDFRILIGERQSETAEMANLWMIATNRQHLLDDVSLKDLLIDSPENRVLWTDDFSNLFTVLHKKLF